MPTIIKKKPRGRQLSSARQRANAAPAACDQTAGDTHYSAVAAAQTTTDAGQMAPVTRRRMARSVTNNAGGGQQVADTLSEDATPATNTDGGGHSVSSSHQTDAAPSLTEEDAATLTVCARRRRGWIKTRNVLTNNAKAYARSRMGWRLDLPADEQARIRKEASDLVDAIVDGEPSDHPAATDVAEYVEPLRLPIANLEVNIKAASKAIENVVERLPIAEWLDGIRGAGYLAVGLILSETGDLTRYANPAKLWARMRLHVENGKAVKGGVRRQVVFLAGDCLVKANKDGKYRAMYLAEKEKQTPLTASKMHAHRRAQRKMEKEFLVDLWKAWRPHHGL